MIYVALDDTDMPETRGTGFVARQIAERLADCCEVLGVSRHQLLRDDPRVPCTRQNSAKVVHVTSTRLSLAELADRAAAVIMEDFIEGSDPGLCVVSRCTPELMAYGQRVKREVVTQDDARRAVEGTDAILRGLGGTNGGVIGAAAAAGLAAGGSDGRFVEVGRIRDLSGPVEIAQVLEAGASAVRTVDGQLVTSGRIEYGESLRPELIDHRPVVLVTAEAAGYWQVHRREAGDGHHGGRHGERRGHKTPHHRR